MKIADVPQHTKALFERVAKSLSVSPLGMWSGYDNNTNALVIVLTPDTLEVVRSTKRQVWQLDELDLLRFEGSKLTIWPAGPRQRRVWVDWDTAAGVREFQTVYPRDNLQSGNEPAVDRLAQTGENAPTPPIPITMVTTLPRLPGYEITELHGVVSELTSASGWTAKVKGNSALTEAMRNVRASAAEVSANAIVGLSANTFGAGGGITNVVGVDAVGVLLMGTAVSVEPLAGPVRSPD